MEVKGARIMAHHRSRPPRRARRMKLSMMRLDDEGLMGPVMVVAIPW
jgi:hypothetical protein